jgi:ribonuclease HI
MKKVVVHSDGGCHGNPGPGGWGAILSCGSHKRELSGGEMATTNNRMEITAAIEALLALKEPCEVDFFTDSEYVKNGVTQWISLWKKNGWRTKERKSVKNADLWQKLDAVATTHIVHWNWLKGHNGHPENERCDQLANAAVKMIKADHPATELKAALEIFTTKTDE